MDSDPNAVRRTQREERAEALQKLRRDQRDSRDRDIASSRRYVDEQFRRLDSASLDRPPLDDNAIMRRALAYVDRDVPLTDEEMDRLAVARVKHHNDWNEALLDVYFQDKHLGGASFSEDRKQSLDKESVAPEPSSEMNVKRCQGRGR